MSSSSTDEEDDATNPTNHDALQAVTPEQFHTFAMCLKLVVTTAVNSAMNSILLQAMNKICEADEDEVLDPPGDGRGLDFDGIPGGDNFPSGWDDRLVAGRVDGRNGIRNSNRIGNSPSSSSIPSSGNSESENSSDSEFPGRENCQKLPFEPKEVPESPLVCETIDKVWPNGDISYPVSAEDTMC